MIQNSQVSTEKNVENICKLYYKGLVSLMHVYQKSRQTKSKSKKDGEFTEERTIADPYTCKNMTLTYKKKNINVNCTRMLFFTYQIGSPKKESKNKVSHFVGKFEEKWTLSYFVGAKSYNHFLRGIWQCLPDTYIFSL